MGPIKVLKTAPSSTKILYSSLSISSSTSTIKFFRSARAFSSQMTRFHTIIANRARTRRSTNSNGCTLTNMSRSTQVGSGTSRGTCQTTVGSLGVVRKGLRAKNSTIKAPQILTWSGAQKENPLSFSRKSARCPRR